MVVGQVKGQSTYNPVIALENRHIGTERAWVLNQQNKKRALGEHLSQIKDKATQQQLGKNWFLDDESVVKLDDNSFSAMIFQTKALKASDFEFEDYPEPKDRGIKATKVIEVKKDDNDNLLSVMNAAKGSGNKFFNLEKMDAELRNSLKAVKLQDLKTLETRLFETLDNPDDDPRPLQQMESRLYRSIAPNVQDMIFRDKSLHMDKSRIVVVYDQDYETFDLSFNCFKLKIDLRDIPKEDLERALRHFGKIPKGLKDFPLQI